MWWLRFSGQSEGEPLLRISVFVLMAGPDCHTDSCAEFSVYKGKEKQLNVSKQNK